MDIYINGYNARTQWGIIPDTQTLSALWTPSPQKALISNTSRLENGKRVVAKNQKVDSRDVTLTLQMVADTETLFLTNYKSFCDELAKGRLEIYIDIDPDVIYRCDYQSCNSFSQFVRGIAKYSLKLNEPDPTDRGTTSIH